jgi:hypothetical protein
MCVCKYIQAYIHVHFRSTHRVQNIDFYFNTSVWTCMCENLYIHQYINIHAHARLQN